MSLKQYINERLRIGNNTKSAHVRPKTKDELISIIEQEVRRQGLDADLNFIDTSRITDMSKLFDSLYYVHNIKIDEWDVSNVEDMSSMLRQCKNFNCDLSGWNVSNVEDM